MHWLQCKNVYWYYPDHSTQNKYKDGPPKSQQSFTIYIINKPNIDNTKHKLSRSISLYNECYFFSRIKPTSRGGSRRAPPLKLEKISFFGVKSWFFTRNTPKIFAPPSAIGKNKIFWSKIVIFHTKYPNNFRASLRSAQFF
jgi:hypothetical protein